MGRYACFLCHLYKSVGRSLRQQLPLCLMTLVTLEACFVCLCPGPGAGDLLRQLALYLFTPAATSLLQNYGFAELPPQVPALWYYSAALSLLVRHFCCCELMNNIACFTCACLR